MNTARLYRTNTYGGVARASRLPKGADEKELPITRFYNAGSFSATPKNPAVMWGYTCPKSRCLSVENLTLYMENDNSFGGGGWIEMQIFLWRAGYRRTPHFAQSPMGQTTVNNGLGITANSNPVVLSLKHMRDPVAPVSQPMTQSAEYRGLPLKLYPEDVIEAWLWDAWNGATLTFNSSLYGIERDLRHGS